MHFQELGHDKFLKAQIFMSKAARKLQYTGILYSVTLLEWKVW